LVWNIWRIRHDQVERAGDSVEKVCFRERHAIEDAAPRGVAPGDAERVRRDICGDHTDLRPLVGQRHREAAAAGADVGDPPRTLRAEGGKRAFHEELRLWTGNEDGWRHLEGQPPEFLVSDDVRERLAGGAPGEERLEAVHEPRRLDRLAGR